MKLYPHQEQALQETENLNRVAYYHDMGLGKTFTGAEKMKRLGAKENLLICQKSKIQDWIDHFEKQYECSITVFDLTKAHKIEQFLNCTHVCQRVGIINYELAWRRKDLLKMNDFTLMLDESSLIQNRKAKQTKFILKLQPKNVILLSGTPTDGKYENLWTQCHLLGWDISEKVYQCQYVNWKEIYVGGMTHWIVDKKNPYKNVERLKSKMREHGATFLKTEEVMDLPEQNFIEVNVSKSKEYMKFTKNSIVTIDEIELVGDTTLTKRLYARQLCGMYSKDKQNAFRDLIQSTNDRLIVFYNFTSELILMRGIACELGRSYSVVNGSVKNLNAYENDEDSITFVQYQAGAMGLNLQKANKIIYFTPPERCELWMQSQKRIHRIGQKKPCYYYKLICSGSVEEDIYKALSNGVDYTDALFSERW